MKLEELCRYFKIPKKEINHKKYRDKAKSLDYIETSLSFFYNEINQAKEFLIIGGKTASPLLLGLRQMRKLSNDIDFITTENGAIKLIKKFRGNESFFYSNYKNLFLEYNGLPFVFNFKKIHDWEIPNDMWDSAVKKMIKDTELKISSPEYTIMLKLRRAYQEKRFFGKDKLDIASLLLAPLYKELKEVNLNKTARLIYENITKDKEEIIKYIFELESFCDANLRKKERRVFKEVNHEFLNNLISFY